MIESAVCRKGPPKMRGTLSSSSICFKVFSESEAYSEYGIKLKHVPSSAMWIRHSHAHSKRRVDDMVYHSFGWVSDWFECYLEVNQLVERNIGRRVDQILSQDPESKLGDSFVLARLWF
ncbi:hypothetical protein Tco_1413303 [Tanacetum coccineum]